MEYRDIEKLVIEAKKGDDESLLKLMVQFKPFIFKTANSFNIKNYDTFDLVQIGYIALINAVDKYKRGSNSFSSYVYTAIKNCMKYTARNNKKHKNILSINSTINECESLNDFTEFFESNIDLEMDFIKKEKALKIQSIISKLDPKDLEMIFLVYYTGFSFKEYALKKGLNYFQVIRRKNSILEYIKNEIIKSSEYEIIAEC
ncbi:sigma-70 family RNA polymerase sigma factor [Clostridium botulinum]|uniref:Sigma-70 family RNA polymerase sigma factor n=3 Tax=Clostridium botulinum TaxID=1491 RepID=A0A846K060_CLOBO|nr:sigma-70 family RNA polymerase sigma factor [Clostridium botulinum]KAI3345050.1 RNA polymerase sigma factor [Clostridium botulinum]KOM87700.1 RNA polymerase sigma factor [Clostridium botulinum]KOR63628.1 RNA polymerase subunit sigma [Clostridium botulinum]MBN1049350.1 sigma-70 family RNA polymerase sigma factor [Clostridium botulinum]MBN1078349.1 sigma-70 family RNA polymerase sigma factor [Clostridium botulinum]